MGYKLDILGSIVRVEDNANIPADPENKDYAEFLAWLGEGNTPAPYTPDQPTIEDIVRERERRLALGFDYDFGDSRGIHHIGTTEQDRKNWDEVTQLAQASINLGQSDDLIGISTNTGPTTVTAMEWQSVLRRAGQVRQPIFAASFALQAMSPIPSNFTADEWWPA